MKRTFILLIQSLILISTLTNVAIVRGENLATLVLPNPKLLRCNSSNCFQLFVEDVEQNSITPRQILLDMNGSCIYGITALYDKSVPVDRIKSEINRAYEKWSVKYPSETNLYLWRVEPQKFSIQLAVTSKQDEKLIGTEVGTRQVVYIALGGKSACSAP